MIGLRSAVASLVVWTITVADTQPYIIVGASIVSLYFLGRGLKARKFQEEIKGLNGAITTLETINRGHIARIEQVEKELHGAETRARQLEMDAQKWKAAHDALVPYSAGPAFERLEAMLGKVIQAGDKRHAETIDLIRRLAGEKAVNP